MSTMLYVWLIIFIAALITEAVVPALVSIWFAAGALASLIMAIFLGDTLIWLQVIVFILVSVATIFAIRPLIMRNKNGKDLRSNVDSLIGQVGFVESPIKEFAIGSIKLNGLIWSAELAKGEEDITEIGSLVQVTEVKGNKLIVKKYREENK